MRTYFAAISIVCLLITSAAGQNITKKYSFPGFIQLNDSLFISLTETDIRDYANFLFDMRRSSNDTGFLKKAFPLPNYLGWTVWNPLGKFLIIYDDQIKMGVQEHIYALPKDTIISYTYALTNYPVVNVTKAQAKMYCDYRTKSYEVFYTTLKKKKKQKYPPTLYFRLPTSSEWICAASSGLDTTKHKYGVADDNQKYSTPVSLETFSSDTTGQSHPYPVIAGQLNQSKILNMVGNVAEFVSDSEFVYGGSFLDPKTNCTVTSKQLFTKPKNNIGFRIVAVIRSN